MRAAVLRNGAPARPPGYGLDQAKGCLAASRHNVQFVFSSHGHLYVEFDHSTGLPPDVERWHSRSQSH